MGGANLATRFRRHADAIERAGRSPLSVALMRGAADDLERQGILVDLLRGIDLPAGQAPALRVLAALHRLVLSGQAPELAEYYPSVGGSVAADDVWPVAAATLRSGARMMPPLLRRSVQTNEPGRAAVLYGTLWWISDRFGLPVRLWEIGASAGLNLLAPEFGYRVGGVLVGDPESPLVFDEPWIGLPIDDLSSAPSPTVVERRGCDLQPIEATSEEGQLSLRSYIWGDELARLERLDGALAVAARNPPPVERAEAVPWLADVLAERPAGAVNVVWQSVMEQYLSPFARRRLYEQVEVLGRSCDARAPLVWVRMEPALEPVVSFLVTCRTWPGGEEIILARAGDHGPPVTFIDA